MKDGQRGVRYEILRGVDNEVRQVLETLKFRLASHQEAMLLFEYLTVSAKHHWLSVAEFLSCQQALCLQRGDDGKESWLFVCGVIKGLFRELHTVRSVGSIRSSLKEMTVDDAARTMWAVLQSYKLMNKFVAKGFLGHPRLSAYYTNHLFRHRLTKRSLDPLEKQVAEIRRELSSLRTGSNNKRADMSDGGIRGPTRRGSY
mmetsp:Transcript_17390/g.42583  ORF Transcript_17390/g.42583 Transcript_17390/m.42583 type:complete len:201 (-) Transcript_17390:34-636(-)